MACHHQLRGRQQEERSGQSWVRQMSRTQHPKKIWFPHHLNFDLLLSAGSAGFWTFLNTLSFSETPIFISLRRMHFAMYMMQGTMSKHLRVLEKIFVQGAFWGIWILLRCILHGLVILHPSYQKSLHHWEHERPCICPSKGVWLSNGCECIWKC